MEDLTTHPSQKGTDEVETQERKGERVHLK